jgi:hypothetical protein
MAMPQRAAVFLTVVFTAGAALAANEKNVAYADEVIQYDPAFGGLAPKRNMDPTKALGKPQRAYHDVSLGRGGLLELAFVEHLITNSGDDEADLRIHEVGPDVESVYVAVQPADEATAKAVTLRCQDLRKPFGDGFCEIGRTRGGLTELDIDAYFPGYEKGQLHFNAVQLVDDDEQGELKGPLVGADIDAVAAVYSQPMPKGVWGYWGSPKADLKPTETPKPVVKMPVPAVNPVKVEIPAVTPPVVNVPVPVINGPRLAPR